MIAQNMAQRLVQQMRGRVVCAQPQAAADINLQSHSQIGCQCAFLHVKMMHKQSRRCFHRISDTRLATVPINCTGITNLSTRLGIEWGLVDQHADALASIGFGDFAAIIDQRCHDSLGGIRCVSQKFGWHEPLAQIEPDTLGGGIARTAP